MRAPDVAFVRADRLVPEEEAEGWYEGAPDLAVEVIWSRSTRAEVRQKLPRFFENGCTLAWVVDIKRRHVEVHRPGRETHIVGYDGWLDGEEVLAGFRVAVADLLGRYGGRRAGREG